MSALISLALLLVSHLGYAQAGVVNSTQNPMQVGLLHWYGAIQSTQISIWMSGDAPYPYGVAFDGASIYATDFMWGYVIKLKASDNTLLQQFGGGYLNQPIAIALDGANIWVANYGSASVTKLRASDGACNGIAQYTSLSGCTFAVGNNPRFLAFDGANIWVANQGSSTVTKLRASDGANLGTFVTGGMPSGVAFDGTNIWVANYSSSTVTKLRASDGSLLGTFPVTHAHGLAFDGTNIWVTSDIANGTVTKLGASNGTNLGAFAVGSAPIGAVYDGANIWVTNYSSNTVTRLRTSDGACVLNGVVQSGPTACTFAVGSNPAGIAFDGANIWVANTGGHTVSKL
jgi:outer membrane lipoprotein-sorting protein